MVRYNIINIDGRTLLYPYYYSGGHALTVKGGNDNKATARYTKYCTVEFLPTNQRLLDHNPDLGSVFY